MLFRVYTIKNFIRFNAYFGFLIYQNYIENNPLELIEMPKIRRKLPDTLSNEEIESMLSKIDLSTEQGVRDRAIIEVYIVVVLGYLNC